MNGADMPWSMKDLRDDAGSDRAILLEKISMRWKSEQKDDGTSENRMWTKEWSTKGINVAEGLVDEELVILELKFAVSS